ncbi:hypothetical protein RSAG8_10575, partial [Rhizoctonia solani AG-8 WAC10335]
MDGCPNLLYRNQNHIPRDETGKWVGHSQVNANSTRGDRGDGGCVGGSCAFLAVMSFKLYAVGATDPGSNIPPHPTDPTCPVKVHRNTYLSGFKSLRLSPPIPTRRAHSKHIENLTNQWLHVYVDCHTSTAVPLPPLQDLFAGDEVARAAYTRLLPLESSQAELLVRILGQLLIQAPSSEGRTFVAKRINDCATDREIIELGESHLNQLVQLFKALRALSSTPCHSPNESQLDLPAAAPTSDLGVENQALVRGNYRCVLSNAVDIDAVEPLPWLEKEVIAKRVIVMPTRCCYILPEQADWDYAEESGHRDTLAHLFGGNHGLTPAGPRTHDLRNMITLDVGCYSSFKELFIWLEPTGEAENQYNIVGRKDYHRNTLPEVVTFSSTSPDLPLPDPQYLAFHAACARVVKFSGGAETIDRILRELEKEKALAEYGSSVRPFDHLLKGESVAVF